MRNRRRTGDGMKENGRRGVEEVRLVLPNLTRWVESEFISQNANNTQVCTVSRGAHAVRTSRGPGAGSRSVSQAVRSMRVAHTDVNHTVQS